AVGRKPDGDGLAFRHVSELALLEAEAVAGAVVQDDADGLGDGERFVQLLAAEVDRVLARIHGLDLAGQFNWSSSRTVRSTTARRLIRRAGLDRLASGSLS